MVNTRTRILLSILSAASLGLVACGGAESGDTTDSGSDSASSDSGGDTAPSDSSGSDTGLGDALKDSPVVHVPKNHRPAATVCAPSSDAGSPSCASSGGGGPPGACKTNADCTAGTNGKCAQQGGGVFFCGCSYDTCTNDSECTTGGPCACADSPFQGVSNGCAPAGNCKVDSDCGAGGYCSPTMGGGCAGGLGGYYCHGASDECVDDGDCAATPSPQACTYDKTKTHWACTPLLLCG